MRSVTPVWPEPGQGTSLLRDRVELVEEKDARRCGLRVFEEPAHVFLGGADELVQHFGALHVEKRDSELAPQAFGQEGLPAARGAEEQHVPREAHAQAPEEPREARGAAQSVGQLLLLRVHSADAAEVGRLRRARLAPGARKAFEERREGSLRVATQSARDGRQLRESEFGEGARFGRRERVPLQKAPREARLERAQRDW